MGFFSGFFPSYGWFFVSFFSKNGATKAVTVATGVLWLSYLLPFRLMQKQLAYMLGRQQILLEFSEDVEEFDDIVEIMSNVHLNNNFLALAREVGGFVIFLNVR